MTSPSNQLGAMMNEDTIDTVSKALRRAWQLGQTYWQQADSDSYKQQDKSDETQKKFEVLVDETRAMLAAAPAAPAQSGEPVEVRSGDDVTVKNVPARIYLNLGDISEMGEIPFQSLTDITWCEDRIDDDDIEYVRAEGSIGEPFPYQKTFDAIAAATSISAGHVAISVTRFREAFGAPPQPSQPVESGEPEAK